MSSRKVSAPSSLSLSWFVWQAQPVVSYGSPIEEYHARDLLDMGGDEVALDLVGHIVARSVPDGLAALGMCLIVAAGIMVLRD